MFSQCHSCPELIWNSMQLFAWRAGRGKHDDSGGKTLLSPPPTLQLQIFGVACTVVAKDSAKLKDFRDDFQLFPPCWPLLCERSQFFHLGEVGWSWLMPPFDSLPSPVFTEDVYPWPFPISWHLYSCATPEYATQVIALSAAALDGGV